MKVVTRMAPSPTGEFHIGGMRTLLYNYAFAKKHKGKFVLRIEDTDQQREVAGAADRLLDVIKDYGLSWDEGPIFQSQRLDIYKEHAERLVKEGHAYYCFCTKERLEQVRAEQKAQGLPVTKYDKHCRELPREDVDNLLKSGEAHVIRLKVPENREVRVDDKVLGEVIYNTNELDDQVLLKSDGYPTYHLAVVVDDHLMEVSHILRGIEWLPSTPKHILLYQAFGWDLPTYVHLPNLKEVGANAKLSKRYGDVSASAFLEQGYLPEALLNFLMFLGWNPGTEREIYSLAEFAEEFDLDHIHKTDLVSFDRDKLLWLNGHYIRSMTDAELWGRVKDWAVYAGKVLDVGGDDEGRVLKAISLVKERLKKLSEFEETTYFLFDRPSVTCDQVAEYGKASTGNILDAFIDFFEKHPESSWNAEDLEKTGRKVLEDFDFKTKDAFMSLRIALTGETATPPLFDVMEFLGRSECLQRLKLIKIHPK